MRLRLVILFALLIGLVPGQALGVRALNCSAQEKAANQAALAAYQKRMAASRKTYFRTHKRAALRKAFVKSQQKKLRRLRDAAACTVASAPAPTTELTFTFAAAVRSSDRDEITRSANAALTFDMKLGRAPSRVDLRVYADAESAAQAFAATTGTSIEEARRIWQFATANEGSGGVIIVNTGSRGWSESDPPHQTKIIAHEIFHVVQSELAGPAWTFSPDLIPPAGPQWLIEGAAEFVGFSAVADAMPRVLPLSFARAENRGNVKFATGPLSDYATQAEIERHPTAAYNLFFVAADYLTRSQGIPALIQFWKAIGAGSPWQDAFRTTFGTTVEQFYVDFERYRATL